MDPISMSALITAVIPFITAGVKKVFTKKLPDEYRAGVNAVIPLALGIFSSGLYTYAQTRDPWTSVAVGLGSGGVASSVRDIDKNLTGIVESVLKLAKKKGGDGQ